MGSRQRRPYRGRCVAPGVAPGAAAAALLLLLLMLAFHCVLSPPLGDGGRDDSPRRTNPTFESNNPGNVLGADASSVHGGGSTLWGNNSGDPRYEAISTDVAMRALSLQLSNRYLMIEASGRLNQQPTGIIDAVIAASILKATLVIPKLDQQSSWDDSSDFADIFDVDSFISSLSSDVKIIQQLPDMVVQLTKFDYRVSNRLETDLQKLRCRVNYHILQFADPIRKMGQMLVQRMREKSGGHFIALHLRFEPDMLAFSGCYFGGGDLERRELGAIRKRSKTLHEANPDRERCHGK